MSTHYSSSSNIGLSSSSRPLSVISSGSSSSLQKGNLTNADGFSTHQTSLSIDSKDGYAYEDEMGVEDQDDEADEDGEDEDEDSSHPVDPRAHHQAGHRHRPVSSSETFCTDDSQSVFAFDLDDYHHRYS